MPPTPSRSYRMDPETLDMIDAIARHDGGSDTAAIKRAVRELYRSLGLDKVASPALPATIKAKAGGKVAAKKRGDSGK